MTSKLEVLDPVAEIDDRTFAPSKRVDTLSGKTLGLVWNGKPGGNYALERLARHISERYDDVRVVKLYDDIPLGEDTLERAKAVCDVAIGSTADCGACTAWLVHDLIELEKSGIPSVGLVATDFVDDSHRSKLAYGMPDLLMAQFDAPELTSLPIDAVHSIIDPVTDKVIDALTTDIVSSRSSEGQSDTAARSTLSETFEGADAYNAWENFNAEFLDRGWGDGFPLIPPTRERVDQMLAGTNLDPETVVAVLEPGLGVATVEKIAINAVMAGCQPSHLPVIIAAVDAMSDRKYWLKNVATSTGPHAPMLVLNGPIVKELGVNYRRGALGPGKQSRVNTVLGRTTRLVLMNIGLSYVGSLDLDTIGSPNKYGMCLAENEDESPWIPLHVERGFARDESAVTVFSVESQMEMYDIKNHTPEGILSGYVGTVGSIGSAATRQWMVRRRHADNAILLGPAHARAIAEHGWSREDVRRYIYEKARITAGMVRTTAEEERIMPSMQWILDAPFDTPLPVTGAYDWFHVVVVGGPVGKSSYTTGLGQAITRRIDDYVAS